jgi:hypothetical protein
MRRKRFRDLKVDSLPLSLSHNAGEKHGKTMYNESSRILSE